MKAVRIEYWVQDINETGHLTLTGLIKPKIAEKHLHLYERGKIVDNDEEY
jgi:hypothetical protein